MRGIYLIERIKEIEDGKAIFYIGQSNDIFKRLEGHCLNRFNQEIDKDISKRGLESFRFRILQIENNQTQRDILEEDYIKSYQIQFGLTKLYNRTSGGKTYKSLINKEKIEIDIKIKDEIKQILNHTIDYPIYLLAEKYNLHFMEIINIRKSLLSKFSLKYDLSKKQIVNKTSKEIPLNWRGHILTQNQVNTWLNNKDLEEDDLVNLLKISKIDYKIFINTFNENYEFAETSIKEHQTCSKERQ